MRNSIIGLIIGAVLGIVLGATVIAPRLQRTGPAAQGTVPAATDIAKQLPRALVARPAVSLKMATAFSLDTPIAGTLARRLDNRIWEVSRGQIEIHAYPPGALAPVADLFEAVSSGAIDAAFASPETGGDTVPALMVFAGTPFGPSTEEFLAWMQFGGGGPLFDEINHAHNVHGLICGILPPTAFGWFRRDLQGLQDLHGLRMDINGFAGRVLARLGVEVVDFPPGELMLALEQGNVDAVAWSSPVIDQQMAFSTWLKYYFPQGWGRSLNVLQLMIGLRTWEGMSASQQAQIETVCGDNVRFGLAEGEATQFRALKEIYATGVHLQRLPPAIEDALERSWQQVQQEASSNDSEFRRVWQSLNAFRADYAVWRELGRP